MIGYLNDEIKFITASGEDPQSTPKPRKSEMMYNHPLTPNQATGVSAHPHASEDFEMGSPPWPRTPASPVFNSHAPPATPQDSYRTTKVKVVNFSSKFIKQSYNYFFVFRNPIA